MSFGADYDEISRIFFYRSKAVEPSAITGNSTIVTGLLVLIAFISLTLTFLGDRKTKPLAVFLPQALVASVSVALSAILVSNYVGVYI